ncbi:hypothetical protein LPC08_17420 [Roseomonas sp. OT10]|uniref:hypothetical protein n=1 Tax=Roseomonas cutis TaxID=2897332 RepID=UPI001E4A8F8C|nr:hypothetical protein [Roseomonas sp. OT10]UFN47780.1 hypothetical protein LPC08_17420 [Roseomonas sp. OT10]
MSKAESPSPADSTRPVAADSRTEREARLAKALRDNLRRRKAQARARADAPAPVPAEGPDKP